MYGFVSQVYLFDFQIFLYINFMSKKELKQIVYFDQIYQS